MDLDDVLAVLGALEQEGVRYAVFGAMAMAAHGLDRATRELDLFVATDEDNVARLRAALMSVFDDPSIAEIVAEDLAGEYPAIQYGPPETDYTIDVVSPRTLFAMKKDTVRGRDRDGPLRRGGRRPPRVVGGAA